MALQFSALVVIASYLRDVVREPGAACLRERMIGKARDGRCSWKKMRLFAAFPLPTAIGRSPARQHSIGLIIGLTMAEQVGIMRLQIVADFNQRNPYI